MANLTEPSNISGWEKWINRIVTIAVALYSALQSLGIIHIVQK